MNTKIVLLFLSLILIPLVSADCNGNTTLCNIYNNTQTCSALPGCYWTPTENSNNGFNHLSIVLILISLAALFSFVGSTIGEKKWLMKSSMYFTSLLIMLITTSVGIQIAETYNLNRLMYLSFLIGVIAFSVFLIFIFVNYIIQIMKAIRDAKEDKKTELD